MTIEHLPRKVAVRWNSRLILVNERVSFNEVHTALKNSFFYMSKFRVPVLNHSAHLSQIKAGAPVLKRLVLDEGWQLLGEDHIFDAVKYTTTFAGKNGTKVTQVVIDPTIKPSALNLIA